MQYIHDMERSNLSVQTCGQPTYPGGNNIGSLIFSRPASPKSNSAHIVHLKDSNPPPDIRSLLQLDDSSPPNSLTGFERWPKSPETRAYSDDALLQEITLQKARSIRQFQG